MPPFASGVTFAIFNSIRFGVSNRIVAAFAEDVAVFGVKRHSIAEDFAFAVAAHSRRSVCPLPIVTVLFCSGGNSFGCCASFESILDRTCRNGAYIRRGFATYPLKAVQLNFLLSSIALAFVISKLPFSN